ncbi:6PF2K domain-containing protein [Mycena kentingensis (nom. inval.)]|nr:6PF2K domain-containing protein [Mycena kentingensis (nom. inval.)]
MFLLPRTSSQSSETHQTMTIIDKPQTAEAASAAVEAPPPAYDPAPNMKVVLAPPAPSSSTLFMPSPTVAPPSPGLTTGAASTPAEEAEWQTKLDTLERKLTQYNKKPRARDEAAILSSMRDLEKSHPDPEVQKYWAQRAEDFENASDENDKLHIVKDVAKAIGVLIAAPFAIAGMILIGTGQLLKVSGNWISGGTLSNMKKKKEKSRQKVSVSS